ncbi:MAG TPA: TIR domain-containing protein [Pyrinomonadaceae bacterium]|nr:TIR domain-containing protein [Pyrinomonadaceae bacterium]
MTHVFISYVHDDKDLVDQLANDLRALGVEVWLDRERIRPGERWKDAIRQAIGKGAFFLCCFSAHYESREKSYMNEELTLAIDELRQYSAERTWFIPVLVSRCEIPSRSIGAGETVRDLQWVDLYTDWSRGVHQIASVILDQRKLAIDQALKFHQRPPVMSLRTVGRNDLTIKEAINMIREREFYEKDWGPQGGAFFHLYYLINEDQDGVIAASETGLLWQQGSSEGPMERREVKKYLKDLNEKPYASFSDWRLPTIEEALSIIGPNGRVDHRFGAPLVSWTCDSAPGGLTWAVEYGRGRCYPMGDSGIGPNRFWVRGVRTWVVD